MGTSATLSTRNEFKLCSNCEHLRWNRARVRCDLRKWEHKTKETFFYNPKEYFPISELAYNTQSFENGVECSEYKGLTYIITDISCTNEPETHQSITGESFTVNFYTYEVQARCDSNMTVLSRSISFSERNKKLEHWVGNLIL